REETGGRVEPEPPGARDEDLGPGVEVGEVAFRAGGAVERLHVLLELDQVAGDEASGEAEVAEGLHEQPAAVAAGARGLRQRVLRRLHARLEPDEVPDLALQALVQGDEEIHGLARTSREGSEERLQPRAGGLPPQVRAQVRLERALVLERPLSRVVLDEEIEGVEGGERRDQVHGHDELTHLAGEHHARLPVAERVLLPVQEVGPGLDFERVRDDRGPGVRRGPQSDGLGRQGDEPVVPVGRAMTERDLYAHGSPRKGASHVPEQQPVFFSIHPSAAPVSSAGDRLFSSTTALGVPESCTRTASSPTLVASGAPFIAAAATSRASLRARQSPSRPTRWARRRNTRPRAARPDEGTT